MATSNQDTNIKDVAAPASATPTNIGHVLGLNAAKTQDVLIPLSMLRQVIAQELQSALSAITSGSPNVPVLDGGNLKYMTLANFAKVAGGLLFRGQPTVSGFDESKVSQQGIYYLYGTNANALGLGQNEGVLIALGPLGESYNFSTFKVQIFFKYDGSIFKWRLYNWSSQTWTSWTDF